MHKIHYFLIKFDQLIDSIISDLSYFEKFNLLNDACILAAWKIMKLLIHNYINYNWQLKSYYICHKYFIEHDVTLILNSKALLATMPFVILKWNCFYSADRVLNLD